MKALHCMAASTITGAVSTANTHRRQFRSVLRKEGRNEQEKLLYIASQQEAS